MTKQNKNDIVIYEGKDGNIELRADIEKDTIWATQVQIANLFDCSTDNVSLHLKNIFADGELDEKAVTEESSVVQKEGNRLIKRRIDHYNLDAIIAVGYRVSSKKATQFRIWATKTLRTFLTGGFSLNQYKLNKSPEALLELYAAMSAIESKGLGGKLKGKITFKMTQEFDPGK